MVNITNLNDHLNEKISVHIPESMSTIGGVLSFSTRTGDVLRVGFDDGREYTFHLNADPQEKTILPGYSYVIPNVNTVQIAVA